MVACTARQRPRAVRIAALTMSSPVGGDTHPATRGELCRALACEDGLEPRRVEADVVGRVPGRKDQRQALLLSLPSPAGCRRLCLLLLLPVLALAHGLGGGVRLDVLRPAPGALALQLHLHVLRVAPHLRPCKAPRSAWLARGALQPPCAAGSVAQRAGGGPGPGTRARSPRPCAARARSQSAWPTARGRPRRPCARRRQANGASPVNVP